MLVLAATVNAASWVRALAVVGIPGYITEELLDCRSVLLAEAEGYKSTYRFRGGSSEGARDGEKSGESELHLDLGVLGCSAERVR